MCQVTYRAADSMGNIGTATRAVVVADSVAPNITLLGNTTLYQLVNTTFFDPGAVAFDSFGM
jgi:hypothetical protein